MLERRSALAAATAFSSSKLTLGEAPGFSLTQVAGFSRDFEAPLTELVGRLPEGNDFALESQGRTIFRIAQLAFWFVGPENDDLGSRISDRAVATPLSSSRTRISVEGEAARQVLLKGVSVDLHQNSFTPGRFALTGLHHTPILLHCVSPTRFELYAMRTFALSVWEWLEDAALEYK